MRLRFLGGLAILTAVTAIVIVILRCRPEPLTTVSGSIGPSKAGLLGDPAVQNILRAKYHLDVQFKTDSRVCGLPPGDFSWPGTEISVQEYQKCHGGGKANAASVYTSPLVFYSWDVVTDRLVKQKLVEQRADGVYYVSDMPRLVQLLDEGKQTWKDFGVPVVGKVAVIPADKSQAESGRLFAALMANTLIDDVATTRTVPPLVPRINAYYARLGNLPSSTEALFQEYINKGMGANPIIVAYESLLPTYFYEKKLTCAQLQSMRVIYPEPTAWASHPFIAETGNGALLMNALLNDKEIETIAWEQYGFRTASGDTPKIVADCVKMPAKILSVTRLPDFATMQLLTNPIAQPLPSPVSAQ